MVHPCPHKLKGSMHENIFDALMFKDVMAYVKRKHNIQEEDFDSIYWTSLHHYAKI